MVKRVNIQGFGDLMATLDTLNGNIFIFFSGSKTEDGNSWCPDCVVAEPVIEKCLSALTEEATFVYCQVGGRDYWKDKSNEFRMHGDLKLTGVPTLMKWKSPRKLVEAQCADEALVSMFFEED